ncbi:alpha-acetolactate decarboxylase [Streptococcus pneumoniae]|nr:alpha-acetolactate decarboxylase [Streptococcus pneumoniae]
MAGLYGGTMTVGELLEHGDLGLGTLDSIDGELIVLDGKAYQAKGSGDQPEIVEVSPDALIPYAAVVPHQAEVIFREKAELDVIPILLLNSLKHFPDCLGTPWQIDKDRCLNRPLQRSPSPVDCV